tara:strand:+ start:2459 stop:2626 length:168 start_codon:yes stop_codon:yes gene_type:complete
VYLVGVEVVNWANARKLVKNTIPTQLLFRGFAVAVEVAVAWAWAWVTEKRQHLFL